MDAVLNKYLFILVKTVIKRSPLYDCVDFNSFSFITLLFIEIIDNEISR